MPQTAPCDHFGRPLVIGSCIVYGKRAGNSGDVSFGKIIGFDGMKVKIIGNRGNKKTLLVPDKIIMVEQNSFPPEILKTLGLL